MGGWLAGLFCNDKILASQLRQAGEKASEEAVSLPLYAGYRPKLKSPVADFRNVSKMKGGGAIHAALFLQKFVGKTKWAHLDIAGPAWAEENINSYTKVGGTGFGVRLLLEFLAGYQGKR